MTGSTLPESDAAFQAPHSGHPVHRATALLEQALHSPADASFVTGPFEAPAVRLAPPQIRPADGTSGTITAETPPIGFFELRQDLGDARAQYQPPVVDRVDVSVLDASGAHDEDKDDMLDYAAHAQLRGLVKAFHHSQREASLIVAGSIGAALALTLCGLLIVFGATSSDAPGPDKVPAQDDVSSVSPEIHLAMETAPALEPIQVSAISDGISEVKLIKAQAGRPLALGPLLPLGVARYVLLRGLPEDATLSAGRHTSASTWMVKGEDIAGLTLTLNDETRGDHAVDIYLLDSGHGPQARRQLILRVDTSQKIYAAGLGVRWPTLFPDASEQPVTVEDPATSQTQTEGAPPPELASQSLASGDIDAARLRLTELAGHGHADAAYQLALTYDHEVLAQAGLTGVEGDMETAQAWYERAAKAGHAEASRRLETVVKRRSGA